MKKKSSIFIGITITVISLLAGIFLPEIILNIRTNKMNGTIKTSSQEYYTGSKNELSRKSSEEMSTLDKMKLASGAWESSVTKVDDTEGTLTAHEAIELAKKQIQLFYNVNIYPESLISAYNNWYLADAELYFCVDSTFNTYSTYIWVIHFTKFDNSNENTVVMTENGAILSAYSTTDFDTKKTITYPYYMYTFKDLWNDRRLSIYTCEQLTEFPDINMDIYPDVNLQGADFLSIFKMTLKTTDKELQDYIIFQYQKDDGYGIGVLPN